jgi:hypothetical protein
MLTMQDPDIEPTENRVETGDAAGQCKVSVGDRGSPSCVIPSRQCHYQIHWSVRCSLIMSR